MYSKKNVFCLLVSLFISCDSAFVDTLTKCDVNDHACIIKLYTGSVDTMAKDGIPELNIPPVDPFVVKNLTLSILGALDLTLVEVVAKGVASCEYSKHKVDLEAKRVSTDLTCKSFSIEGHYKISTGPLLQNMLGNVINGDGNGKLYLETMHLTYDLGFEFEKDSKGDIFFKCNPSDSTYTIEILDNATLEAEKVFLGSQDVSKIIVTFFNENWSNLLKAAGKIFSDVALGIYFENLNKFFSNVPATKYFSNDLSKYV